MKIHEPTEWFEDGVRSWKLPVPCCCGEEISIWFFDLPGTGIIETKVIHLSDVSVGQSYATTLRDIIGLIGNVLTTFNCGVPWSRDTTFDLMEMEL